MVEGKKEYEEFYYIHDICPYCNHNKVVEIDDSTFFNWKPTRYKCSRCSREFKSTGILSVVPKDEVKRIVQGALNGDFNKKEMKEAFGKIGIYINIPYKKKTKK